MSVRKSNDIDFEIEFFEGIVERDPLFEEPLMALGNAYTRKGNYQKGLSIDQRLVQLRPKDPIVYYNLACSHSLLNDLDAAFDALEYAIKLGYNDCSHIMEDSDLQKLRKDPRFPQIILSYFEANSP